LRKVKPKLGIKSNGQTYLLLEPPAKEKQNRKLGLENVEGKGTICFIASV